MQIILKAIVLSCFLIGLGCASKPQVPTGTSQREEEARSEYEKGLNLMDQERFKDAAKVFSKLLVDSPALEFDYVILFNLGAAQEGMKDCKAASETYRQVVRGSNRKFQRLEALSLMRMSYAYECLGQDSKVLVALLDARRLAAALPEDTAKSELPARIAAAYARAGNRAEAEKYFRLALDGIKFMQVKYKDSMHMGDKLSEALFFMGKSNVSEAEFRRNPVAQIRGLELMQTYLLQAAELGSPKWSGRAVDEILGTYNRLWNMTQSIETDGATEPGLKKRLTADLRQEVIRSTLKSVRSLRAQRLPSRSEAGESRRLFARLAEEDRRLSNVLAEMGPTSGLTSEAERRQGLKATGRVENAQETELEKATKNRSKGRP